MWYSKYCNLKFEHLGDNPETGIDCFNLNCYILKNEKGIEIPYRTKDICKITDFHWYNKTAKDLMLNSFKNPNLGWEQVSTPQIFDVITMHMGSSNITNHCVLYVENNKILQTMALKQNSWVSPYGNYYRQYTTGIFRWKGISSDKLAAISEIIK